MGFSCKLGFHSWEKDDCSICSKCGMVDEGNHSWDGCSCSKCGKENHSWDGCKCSKCRKIKDENHAWDGCKCSKCGKTKDENHSWKKDDCNICSKCGFTRIDGHLWNGCKCSKCNKTRDENHTWDGCKCSKCGKNNNTEHKWKDYFCVACDQFKYPDIYTELLKYLKNFKYPEKFLNNFINKYKDTSHFRWPNKPDSYRYDCSDLRDFEINLTKSILIYIAIIIQEKLNGTRDKITNDQIKSVIYDITNKLTLEATEYDKINESHLNEFHILVKSIFNRISKKNAIEKLSAYLKTNFFITACELAKYTLFVFSTKNNIDEKILYGIRIPLYGYFINITESKDTDGDMMAIECWKSDEIIDPELIKRIKQFELRKIIRENSRK